MSKYPIYAFLMRNKKSYYSRCKVLGLPFMDFWGRGVHSVNWLVHLSTTNHNFWKYIEHFCVLGTDIKRAIFLPSPKTRPKQLPQVLILQEKNKYQKRLWSPARWPVNQETSSVIFFFQLNSSLEEMKLSK